jgi:hypothetical protein
MDTTQSVTFFAALTDSPDESAATDAGIYAKPSEPVVGLKQSQKLSAVVRRLKYVAIQRDRQYAAYFWQPSIFDPAVFVDEGGRSGVVG